MPRPEQVSQVVFDEGKGAWDSQNIEASCTSASGSNYTTTDNNSRENGGYLYGDAHKNAQQWVVVKTQDKYLNLPVEPTVMLRGLEERRTREGDLCGSHACESVKVYNVAPGVQDDGDITSWWTESTPIPAT